MAILVLSQNILNWSRLIPKRGEENFALLAGIFLVSVLLSAPVERCFVSRMRDFSNVIEKFQAIKKPKHHVKRFEKSLDMMFLFS